MSYTADQQAAVKKTIAAVRGDTGKHGKDLFVFWLTRSPDQLEKFPKYASVDAMKSVSTFPAHAKAVVDELLNIVEVAEDSGALNGKIKALMTSHASRDLSAANYENLWGSLVPFLEQALGGAFTPAAKAGWQNVGGLIINAIKSC